MTPCTTPKFEPGARSWVSTFASYRAAADGRHLPESLQARHEKLSFILADSINGVSSTGGVTTDSRIRGKEVSIKSNRQAEQQKPNNRKHDFHHSEHRELPLAVNTVGSILH